MLTTNTDRISSLLPTSTIKESSTPESAEFPRVVETEPPRVFGRAFSRVVEVRDRYDIRTPMIKKFNGVPYKGNVISNNVRWYNIKYENVDEAELTHCEMTKFVQQTN